MVITSKIVEWIAIGTGFLGVGAWVGKVDSRAGEIDNKVEINAKDIERLSDTSAGLAVLTERVDNLVKSTDDTNDSVKALLLEIRTK